jgi:hypothetical protein
MMQPERNHSTRSPGRYRCAMLSSERRWLWLTASAVIAGAVWLIPFFVLPPGPQPLILGLVQVAIGGLILGLGRQGIDVLILRLLIATIGVSLGLVLSGLAQGQTLCRGVQDCFQYGVLLFGFGGLVLAILMAVIALPTTIAWRRGFAGLGPELQWPLPRGAWQRVVLSLLVIVGFYVLVFLLGFPWPA